MRGGPINFEEIFYKFENRPIYQPELSTFSFYYNNDLMLRDYYITNKLIKREKFIKALNSLNTFFSNIYMTIAEDTLMTYLIYKKSNSFYFVKKVGYYYLKNSESIGSNYFKLSDLRLKFSFIFLKCIFDYSKNNKYEKDMVNYLLKENHEYQLLSAAFSESFYFYYDVINMLLNCSFITNDNINILQKYKKIIEKKNQTYVKQKKKELNYTFFRFIKSKYFN